MYNSQNDPWGDPAGDPESDPESDPEGDLVGDLGWHCRDDIKGQSKDDPGGDSVGDPEGIFKGIGRDRCVVELRRLLSSYSSSCLPIHLS